DVAVETSDTILDLPLELSAEAPISCTRASCSDDQMCVDDPADACDPNVVSDCPSICVSCFETDGCGGCASGEWCDVPTSGTPTCRCGNGPACTGGNICA